MSTTATQSISAKESSIFPNELKIHKFTGMVTDPKKMSLSDRMWNEDRMFYYCNEILDQYSATNSKITLFRNASDYGPKSQEREIIFYPFLWGNEWQLAIGFKKYKKILFIYCSEYNPTPFGNSKTTDSRPSFPIRASLKLEEFIYYFGQKLSKNALKYPRLYQDLFEPVSSNSSINLLTVIFAFCLDSVALTRSFCDAEYSPRKYDISEFFEWVSQLDNDSRKDLEARMSPSPESIINAENETLKSEKKSFIDRKKEEVKREIEKRKTDLELGMSPMSKRSRILESKIGTQNEPIELEDDNGGNKEKDEDNEEKSEEESEEEEEEDEEDDEDKEVQVKKEYGKDNEVGHKDKVITLGSTSNKLKEKEARLFPRQIAINFLKYVKNLKNFNDETETIDAVVEMLENLCHNSITNKTIKETESSYQKWSMLVREHLYVEYTRRTKQEFDEEELKDILNTADHKNQIVPMYFENGTVFLVNLATEDNFHCVVNVICFTNKANKAEREVIKNFALKRLIEIYVWQHKRLITKIQVSVIPVLKSTLYELFMYTLYCIHYFVWTKKFDVNYVPKLENVKNYTIFFEEMMQNIKERNKLGRDLNYRRTLKYLLK